MANPGYGKTSGFMPGVKTFFVATTTGRDVGNPQEDRNALHLHLVPGVRDANVAAPDAPTKEADDNKVMATPKSGFGLIGCSASEANPNTDASLLALGLLAFLASRRRNNKVAT